MSPFAVYHGLIDLILVHSGMSDKMIHVHVGMAIYLLFKLLVRDRRGSWFALMMVVTAEMINEAMDAMFFG